MVNINLLPWRSEALRYQIKMLKIMLISAVLAPLVLLLIIHYLLIQRIQELDIEIAHLKKSSEPILRSAPAIASSASLQAKQLATSQFFMVLSAPGNTNICFTEITRRKNKITFMGNADSIENLTTFLQHWPTANLFTEIKIVQLQQSDQNTQFQLQANENSPNNNDDDGND